MMRLAIPVFLTLASLTKAIHYQTPFYSAASDAQIRFALENKYDDTGPGAKEPEYAYNTYKTLEEALVGYLDDPDTKLPEHERERAISSLAKPVYNEEYKPNYDNQILKRYYPKTVEEYTGYNQQKEQEEKFSVLSKPINPIIYKEYRFPQPQLVLTKLSTSPPKKFYHSHRAQSPTYFKQVNSNGEVAEPYRLEKVKLPSRPNPLELGSYNKDPDFKSAQEQYDPHPKYTFSYGVHVPDTGDTKSAHETREGGTVRGYYSFVDPDGKQRTVHYTANDNEGFRATVERE